MISKRRKNKVAVLAYHRVLSESDLPNGRLRSPYAMTLASFEKQMYLLVEIGFQAVTLDEVLSHPDPQAKRVVLTFDDGYVDNYTQAWPVLRHFGFKATFFVIANRIGSEAFMSWQQLKEMTAAGMAVESHTANHQPLTSLSNGECLHELVQSRQTIEARLGRPVRFVSFPHGMYDRTVLQACRKAGYAGGCNSDFGYFKPGGDVFKINRFMVKKDYDLKTFSEMVRGRWQFAVKVGIPKRVKQQVTRLIGFERYQSLYKKFYGAEETVT
ncbi:MAG: polysaccharide deacetylase family protein [bacterium]